MRKTYPSATVEVVTQTPPQRYVFCRAELYDDRLEAYDKATGRLLAVVQGKAGTQPGHSRDWLSYGSGGDRVREHCGGCTRNRTTRVEALS